MGARRGKWRPSIRLALPTICLLNLFLCAGCITNRPARFLPADQVRRVRISQQGEDLRVIEDPQQIAQVTAFLQDHRSGWSPIWDTPWAGDYSIQLEADRSWQTVFVNADMLQTNSDGSPIQRKLSPQSQNRLLALLGTGPGGVAAGPSSQPHSVEPTGFTATR